MHHVFLAEGSKVVMELLNSEKIVCEHILAKPIWLKENEGQIRKYFKGTIEVIEDFELERISALTTPGHVVGVFKKRDEGVIEVQGKITLVLDGIQDPGNLGTMIRIADWFGISAVICSENCADLYNPKVVQSTMGSIGRVEVRYTNLVEWLNKNKGIRIYAAALEGINLYGLKGLQEGIIIIGNESRGISEEIFRMANEKITIPKTGYAESLNAAVAAGIIISHLTSPLSLSIGAGT
ncbi:MAG: RNA methyltransferase [Ferruginibacter sp.]